MAITLCCSPPSRSHCQTAAICDTASRLGAWRSGSAAALHAVGRGFESLSAYHLTFRDRERQGAVQLTFHHVRIVTLLATR